MFKENNIVKAYNIAVLEHNVKEIVGKKHNPRIIEYHNYTNLKATTDEIPWCSSFVNWCVFKANLIGTRSAAARSWLKWKHGKKVEYKNIYKGCLVVLKRGNHPWQGHVGFYAGLKQNNKILVLGGNQKNKVCYLWYKESDILEFIEANG